LQKTTKARKERRSDESQFVIMVLIPCQESKKARKTPKQRRGRRREK
jgi:hypothetical protein